MPALLKLVLIFALALLVFGFVVKALQFLPSVGLVVLAGAGIAFTPNRPPVTR